MLLPFCFLVFIGLFVVILYLYISSWLAREKRKSYRAKTRDTHDGKITSYRNRKKPDWVRAEVIRLKALMPRLSCNKLAEMFNRLHTPRNMTVGRTYVAETVKKYHYEIEVERRNIKHRRPRPMPRNKIWAMDLTFVANEQKQSQPILGILDHGSRALLTLQSTTNKSALLLLARLFEAFAHFGVPKIIRCDNEASFRAKRLRWALKLIGVSIQYITPGYPWQNGRIERLFGTFKQVWRQSKKFAAANLQDDLVTFRFWYNHIRTHQHLDGLTPAEVWSGSKKPNTQHPEWFEARGGVLSGYYFRPT